MQLSEIKEKYTMLAFLEKLFGLGPLKGKKVILSAILMLLAKAIPGFPVIDVVAGITPDQILLIFAALQKLVEKFRQK